MASKPSLRWQLLLETLSRILPQMANVTIVGTVTRRPQNSGIVSTGGIKLYVHDVIDDQTEYDRVSKLLTALHERIMDKLAKVSNKGFRTNAKTEIIVAEQNRLHDLLLEDQLLSEYQEELLNCMGDN